MAEHFTGLLQILEQIDNLMSSPAKAQLSPLLTPAGGRWRTSGLSSAGALSCTRGMSGSLKGLVGLSGTLTISRSRIVLKMLNLHSGSLYVALVGGLH